MRGVLANVCAGIALGIIAWSQPTGAESATILRDEFGVPHIFAESEAGCTYAMGYAQGEDRLAAVLKNYLRAEGRMAEVFGPEHFNDDFRARMWRHYAKSEELYETKSPFIRAITESFVAGLKKYMADHPENVPQWAPEVTPYHISAVGRLLIWGWPEGEAAADLRRGGINYEPDGAYHGSNQWLVASERSAFNAPIALIDPHLSWYGLFRFYEARYYGGELAYSGMAVPGLPLGTLGHSRYCSVAMTTGGPDTADVFYYDVNPDNPLQYRFDGAWRDLEVVEEVIRIRTNPTELAEPVAEPDRAKAVARAVKVNASAAYDEKKVTFQYAHLGPVVARDNGKIYVMALPYWNEIYHIDQVYAMNTARNIEDMKAAFRMLQYMSQNIMVATVDSDILYFRNGRVPIRSKDYDYTRPIDGNEPKAAWQGLHPIEDLVQTLNPPQGYMHNCNVSPFAMMKNSPMLPEDYPGYIYNDDRTPPHQRAAMTLEQLAEDGHVTLDDAFQIAMSTQVYGAGAWKDRLYNAWKAQGASENGATLVQYIRAWKEHSDADSVGALAYWYWKKAVHDVLTDDEKTAERFGAPPPERLDDATVMATLEAAATSMMKSSGLVPFGEVFRVGRQAIGPEMPSDFPVGGGNPGYGMATPRNIGFRKGNDNQYLGQSGQTSTQIVVLTNPPQSWTYLPLGESDNPQSPHYDDQAESLLGPGVLKPTYFGNRNALEAHVTQRQVLQF